MMEEEVGADLLKISWAPLGFELSGSRRYAVKLHVHVKQLHTMLTDYEHIYYENALLAKKFTSLNAKLSGSENMLLEKVRSIFLSPKTKVSHEKIGDGAFEFDLETVVGKRNLKWHFSGKPLHDSGNYIYLHITRPLANMLSVVMNEYDLSSLHVSGSGSNFSDPFGTPAVQKLYEAIVAEPQTVQQNHDDDDDDDDDESEEIINRGAVVGDTIGNDDGDEDSGTSLSATPPPPPSAVPEVISNTAGEDMVEETTKNVRISPSKKPRLKF